MHACVQARAEAAAELGGVAGAGPKLLHFVRSTPLVASTLVGHKQTVQRPLPCPASLHRTEGLRDGARALAALKGAQSAELSGSHEQSSAA